MAKGSKRDPQLHLEFDGTAGSGSESQEPPGVGEPQRARTTFVVGRIAPGAGEIVVGGFPSPPFPGPWTLRALVRPPPLLVWPGSDTVH